MKLKIKSKRLLFSILLIVFLLAIYSYFRHTDASPPNQPVSAITVAAAPVIKKNITVDKQLIGTVQPMESVSLKSLVDGQVISVNFKEGDMVKQGQLLVSIDPRPFEVQLQTAQANLARDQAQYANAQSQLKRAKKLLPNGYIARQDFDTLKANASALTATLQADEAAVANAKLQLSYTKIYAPISGKTGNLLIKPGNLVKANDTNPLVVINQISPIYIVFSMPEQKLNVIRQELNKGSLKVNALNQEGKLLAQGQLSFIDNSVDTTTGTIQMKATFNNKDFLLWPGQFVTVQVPTNSLDNALLVPTLAIQAGPDGNYVFVVDAGEKVSLRPVGAGATIGNQTVITSGLKAGEQVVTEGQLRLTDGAPIRLAAPSAIS